MSSSHARRGRRSLMPQAGNNIELRSESSHAIVAVSDDLIQFDGEDGRSKVFDVGTLPLPGWQIPVGMAIQVIFSPAGRVRTLSSAINLWSDLRVVLGSLAKLPNPPDRPEALTRAQLASVISELQLRCASQTVYGYMSGFRTAAMVEPLASAFSQEVQTFLERPVYRKKPNLEGYSQREFNIIRRTVVAHVAQLTSRIRASEALIASEKPADRKSGEDWEMLTSMAATGIVPAHATSVFTRYQERMKRAGLLFVTIRDMPYLLALLMISSGRNLETIKEFRAEHEVVEGKALRLATTKRRQGQGKWDTEVLWEIGKPEQELQTAGGSYLLVHELTARSRGFAKMDGLWGVWRDSKPGVARGHIGEHRALFIRSLGEISPELTKVASIMLADPTSGVVPLSEEGDPLRLTFQRLRKTVEGLRLRKSGGHLKSTAMTNTPEVLYASYMRSDPSTREWGEKVVSSAIEQAMKETVHPSKPTTKFPSQIPVRANDDDEPSWTPWTACESSGMLSDLTTVCPEGVLTCFQCPNARVTPEQLPGVLHLAKELSEERGLLPQADWELAYEVVWTAIVRDILPAFSEEQVSIARIEAANLPDVLPIIRRPWGVGS